MKVVGIDPGARGGFALLENKSEPLVCPLPVLTEPTARIDTGRLFEWLRALEPDLVAVEAVTFFRSSSPLTQMASSANWGRILACLEVLKVPHVLYAPKQWQAVAGVPKGSAETNKARALARCTRLFPAFNPVLPGCTVPHDGMVDAVLIAYAAMWDAKAKR